MAVRRRHDGDRRVAVPYLHGERQLHSHAHGLRLPRLRQRAGRYTVGGGVSNRPPVAVDDVLEVGEDFPGSVDVLSNDETPTATRSRSAVSASRLTAASFGAERG